MANVIDTDVLIDVTKGNPNAIAYLESLTDLAINSITAMEIIVGAKTQRQTLALDASLAAFPLLPLRTIAPESRQPTFRASAMRISGGLPWIASCQSSIGLARAWK